MVTSPNPLWKECNGCSCLDAAYERLAILEGLRSPSTAQFIENIQYFKKKVPPCRGHSTQEE